MKKLFVLIALILLFCAGCAPKQGGMIKPVEQSIEGSTLTGVVFEYALNEPYEYIEIWIEAYLYGERQEDLLYDGEIMNVDAEDGRKGLITVSYQNLPVEETPYDDVDSILHDSDKTCITVHTDIFTGDGGVRAGTEYVSDPLWEKTLHAAHTMIAPEKPLDIELGKEYGLAAIHFTTMENDMIISHQYSPQELMEDPSIIGDNPYTLILKCKFHGTSTAES